MKPFFMQANKITTCRDGVSSIARIQRDKFTWPCVANITGVSTGKKKHVCESNGMSTVKHECHPAISIQRHIRRKTHVCDTAM